MAEAAGRSRLSPPSPFETLRTDELLIVVFARVPFACHGTVRCVSRRLNTVLQLPAFRIQREEIGYVERGIVIAGGYRGGHPTAECSLLVGGRWRPIAPMSGPRSHACSAVIENELVVCGGVDGGNQFLATVEAYNPQTNQWRSLPNMSHARSAACCGVVGGSLICAGGRGEGGQPLSSAEAYSPATGWTPLPPMPHPATCATACVLNDKLFIAGAGDDWNKMLMWDPAENSWTVKADLPAGRWGAASAVNADGKIMVIGGYVHNDDEDGDAADDGADNSFHAHRWVLEGRADVPVDSVSDALTLIAKGDACKRRAATAMNERSSRAHALVVLTRRELDDEAQREGGGGHEKQRRTKSHQFSPHSQCRYHIVAIIVPHFRHIGKRAVKSPAASLRPGLGFVSFSEA